MERTFKKIFFSCIGVLIGISQAVNAEEWTANQVTISRIEYDGRVDELWFWGSSKWAPPSCPDINWIRILPSVPGRKQILALATAAKIAGRTVAFYGDCDSGKTSFNATYIRVD